MYKVIEKYCNNNNNGLFLLDMPTGYGKTYTVLKYIYNESLKEANRNKRFFFITTLKKNLPIEELRERFDNAGKLDEFNKKFLFIDSNADCVIDGLTDEIINEIPPKIKNTEEYKKFKNNIKLLQKQKNENNVDLREYIGSIKEELRNKIEPNFRKMLKKKLEKEFPTVDKRIYEIKTNKDWKWLGKLYPAVFTRDKQIIFLSMDKFLTRNATIVEDSYLFYNSDIIDNALIFIDEFDATKETLLKNIIQNGLKVKIDYIDLFKQIYSALQINKFPTQLTTQSKRRKAKQEKEGKYEEQSLQFIIDKFREKADDIHQDYNLQFSYKTVSNTINNTKNFLFHDHQFHSILDEKNSYIITESDTKNRINAIRFSPNKPNTEKNNIQVMLGKLRGFIKYFQNGINMLANNYIQCKAENGDDDFTIEEAIHSILTEFKLGKSYIDYITSQILISSYKKKDDIENSDFDLSFYQKGFRYYSFEDDTFHDMQSKIMMCSFQSTPEKILLRFCEKAKVIGISATATVPTVIGNYDLNYLQSKMQEAFSLPSEDDKRDLHSDFNKSLSGYDGKVYINVELLDGSVKGNYNASTWEIVFDSKECATNIFGLIEHLSDNDNYHKERYIRIALAYKRFVLHNDIQSFLCVLTKHPRKGDKYLNMDVLNEIFKCIIEENKEEIHDDISVESSVYQLDGDEYDSKKDEIISKLSKGQKLFVISVYQTIGAGQNLQYPIPNELKNKMIKINDRSFCEEKDFDAIYLDMPTNLLINLNNNLSEDEFVKYLYQIESLQETSELSMSDAFIYIKKAFYRYIAESFYHQSTTQNPNESNSAIMLSTRMLIQAIGRICRTNNKRKNIYIFADKRIAEKIHPSISDDRLLNKEFLELLNKVKEQSKVELKEVSFKNKATLLSVKANIFIKDILRDGWTDNKIKKWQYLRELVLKSPTMSATELSKNSIAKNFYVELPSKKDRLYYKQENDYSNIQISFNTKSKDLNLEVSGVAAKLNILMNIKGLKEFFEKNGWATSFVLNDYIMCPPLFNNIYKGALGEVVGKYLFRMILKREIEEIKDPEQFELFDYKVKDLPIYIDFKNWHETTVFNDGKMMNKIKEKAIKCRAKCIIIANIISEKEWKIQRKEQNGLVILEIPSLLTSLKQNNVALNNKAWKEIERCLNEISDQN